MSTFVLVSFLLQRIITRFTIKKLLAIVNAFNEWHHLFEGAQHEITMFPNHKSLQYFMTIRVLNQYQV
jgi:hypothetical protein